MITVAYGRHGISYNPVKLLILDLFDVLETNVVLFLLNNEKLDLIFPHSRTASFLSSIIVCNSLSIRAWRVL